MEQLKRVVDFIKDRDTFTVVCHYDSVTGDSELLASVDGELQRVTMVDLFQNYANEELKKGSKSVIRPNGVKVFSIDKKGKIKLSKVKAILKHRVTKKIYSINTPIGQVKVTKDHSLITLRNTRLVPEKPKLVKYVASPLFYPISDGVKEIDLLMENGISTSFETLSQDLLKVSHSKVKLPRKIKINKDLMTFFGMWLADGSYNRQRGREGVRISSCNDHECKTAIEKVFGFFGATPCFQDKGVTCLASSKTLYDLMRLLQFEGNSKTKRVPSWIFGLKKDLIAALLRGYFSGDGTVSKGDINATTFSKKLAFDVQTLLLFFSIRARIRKEHGSGYSPNSEGYKLSINNAQMKKIFLKHIGFLQKRKNEKVNIRKKSTSNYQDYIPLEQSMLSSLEPKLRTKDKRYLREIIRKGMKPTRRLLSRLLKRAKGVDDIRQLLEMEVFWEKPKVQLAYDGQYIDVYDIETEEGNFVCNNLVLKNSDGLSAGAIISSLLDRLGKSNTVIPTKQMDSERINLIKQGKNHIFADFGSGQIPILEEHLPNYAIIDHHATLGETDKPHFNAHLIGLDGAKEISGAGMTYLVAKEFGFSDLSALAIVGAVGDMQDSTGQLVGYNRKILEDAEKAGVITSKKDIRLFGRHSRPLTQFIQFASDPIFPGLTGDEEAATNFLTELDIPIKQNNNWLYYVDLNDEQKRKLLSALYVYGKQQNIPENYLKSLVGEVYELTNEKDKSFVKDAKDFATLLNACGRHEQGEIGVQVAKGNRTDYYEKAEALLLQHRRQLREGIEWATQKGVEDHGSFYLLDAGDAIKDTLIGVIAGMLYGAQIIQQDKPIIGLSYDPEEGKMKASGRATWPLVRSGIHLGEALKKAASSVGGEGGGHCLHPKTLVQLKNGEIKRIDEIENDTLKNVDLTHLHQSSERVSKRYKKRIRKQYEISTLPFKICCSGDHKLFIFRENKIKEILARDLHTSDFLLGVRKIDAAGKKQKLPKPKLEEYVRLTEKGRKAFRRVLKRKHVSAKEFATKTQLINDSEFYRFLKGKITIIKKRFQSIVSHLTGFSTKSCLKNKLIQIEYMHNTQLSSMPPYLTPSLAQIIGYTMGDGCRFYNKGIELKDASKQLLLEYNKLFKKSFKKEGVISKVKNKNCHRLRVYSTQLCSLFDKLGVFDFSTMAIERSKNNVVAAFVRGLFDAEGTIGHHEIKIYNSNKDLLRRVQIMLLRFGILSSVLPQGERVYAVSISDMSSMKHFLKLVGSSSREKFAKMCSMVKNRNKAKRNSQYFLPMKYKDIKEFFNVHGISKHPNQNISLEAFKKKILSILPKSDKKRFSKLFLNDSFVWCKIKKIEIVNSPIEMYDLTLPKNKNFIANGLVVHNSVAAGAHFPPEKRDDFLKALQEALSR